MYGMWDDFLTQNDPIAGEKHERLKYEFSGHYVLKGGNWS
jgi:hypothetical protein